MTGRTLRAFVDRIEGDKAILLVGDREQHRVILPVEFLPDGAGKGAVLTINMEYEPKLTAKAFAESQRLLQRLRDQDEPGGAS